MELYGNEYSSNVKICTKFTITDFKVKILTFKMLFKKSHYDNFDEGFYLEVKGSFRNRNRPS